MPEGKGTIFLQAMGEESRRKEQGEHFKVAPEMRCQSM
jgi:hypothetical protein